ncbi:MAG: adenylosuccinate synthetase, partial [bacterium]
MATLVVTGAQWGDEAKGKLVDVLAEWANVVVRYNGGANAGHTVQVGENVYKFHLIPTGVLRPNLLSIVSSGVVIEPKALILEMAKFGQGQVTPNNFKISSNAHVVLPYHQLTEQIDEKSRGDEKIGTTNRGIGPTYVDKTARSGIRMIDFIDPARFKNKLTLNLEIKNRLFEAYGEKPFSVDELLAEYLPLADQLRPYVADIEMLIHDKVAKGDNVLFEGAQGTLLDLDYGTYPFVTSSHPVAAGACLG